MTEIVPRASHISDARIATGAAEDPFCACFCLCFLAIRGAAAAVAAGQLTTEPRCRLIDCVNRFRCPSVALALAQQED